MIYTQQLMTLILYVIALVETWYYEIIHPTTNDVMILYLHSHKNYNNDTVMLSPYMQ